MNIAQAIVEDFRQRFSNFTQRKIRKELPIAMVARKAG
jgi:hypothetical protein